MHHRLLASFLFTALFFLSGAPAPGAEPALRQIRETKDPARAALRVRAGERSLHPIPRFITGKFAEHLWANIYNGMDAQILRNPTFADWPFGTGQTTPDGVTRFHSDDEKIIQELRRQAATRAGWPESELDELVRSRADALACFWTREGPRDAVQPSPDTGPHGNELWGKWQFGWTTAEGYVDRYREFSKAMLAADPTTHLYACGAPVFWGNQWNDTLIAGAAPQLGSITDHPLIGGTVPPSTEPLDVYRDFMAVPEVLEQKWAALRDDMIQAGVKQPRLAVTELQLFARLGRAAGTNAPARLTRENLPGQASITEAIYDILIYHAAIRLSPFVEMVTHSATVNHGGGLRKERERVWANPCHHAQAAFAAFAGATPVAVEIETATERAPMVLPDLKNATREISFSAVDALGALANDGSLLLSVVHRGSSGPVRLGIEFADFKAGGSAAVRTLAAEVPWAANSLETPHAIKPVDSAVALREGKLELDLQPYSIVRIHIPER